MANYSKNTPPAVTPSHVQITAAVLVLEDSAEGEVPVEVIGLRHDVERFLAHEVAQGYRVNGRRVISARVVEYAG